MQIDADLDGGSIVVLDATSPSDVQLALRADTGAEFRQWFHFRVRGAKGRACCFNIDASQATYLDAYEGYRACASYDGEHWFRVPTELDGTTLRITHTPTEKSVLYGYFAPYSWERHCHLLSSVIGSPHARTEVLGQSVEGRDMTVIVVGDHEAGGMPAEEKLRIWITARQHPGETMAEWFMEGVLERLLNQEDELCQELFARAIFYLVPSMNPDGGVHGNLRANAVGTNLNREWVEPSLESSPEVVHVRERMLETGVDLFLDIHGDERNPYCFAAGCEGNPSYDERLDALEDLFMDALIELDEDFQREYGYERDQPGEGDLTCASNWVGEHFDCLSLTLEMPFKDDANHPDPLAGWSPERARQLGASTLETIYVCLDSLR